MRCAFPPYGLVVSSIYVWYKADFGGTDQAVIEHLKQRAAPEQAAELDRISRISGDTYDWRLNDAGAGRSGSCT